jgi:hypothetical protein
MANIFTTIIDDIKGLWEKEKPAIEAGLSDVLKAVEPVWKTALGSIVLSTVTNLQGYAASAGGAAAAKTAANQVAVALKAAGKTAAQSTINTLIELAVQKLQSVAPAAN